MFKPEKPENLIFNFTVGIHVSKMKLSLIYRHPILRSFLDEMRDCEVSTKKLIQKDPLARYLLLYHPTATSILSLCLEPSRHIFLRCKFPQKLVCSPVVWDMSTVTLNF